MREGRDERDVRRSRVIWKKQGGCCRTWLLVVGCWKDACACNLFFF